MKKITILWLGHYFWDSRIFYKQALSLSKEFEVKCLWWIFSSKKWEFEVKWIKNIWFSSNRLFILFKAWWYGIKYKSDIYVAHDIDSYLVVVWIKLFRWKSKIIFDSHEYYNLYDKAKFSKIELILLFIFSKIIKPSTIRLFNWVTVVTEDMKDFYRLKNKEVIYNFPSLLIFNNIKKNNLLYDNYKYFIYHWSISEDRWLNKMLEIYIESKKIFNNLKFLIIWPFSRKTLEVDFKEKIKKLWLEKNIIITWKLSYEVTISYIKNSVPKIWFCLFSNTWQISKSIPIKMLEYLYLEIPQIWSNHIKSFNKIIVNNKTWLAINYWNIQESVNAVKEIYNNYNEYTNNCWKIKNNYTWENEEKKLLEFYKKLINER